MRSTLNLKKIGKGRIVVLGVSTPFIEYIYASCTHAHARWWTPTYVYGASALGGIQRRRMPDGAARMM